MVEAYVFVKSICCIHCSSHEVLKHAELKLERQAIDMALTLIWINSNQHFAL